MQMNLSYLHWACRYIQDLIIVVDIYRIFSVATHACRQLRTNAVQTKISRLFFFRGRFCSKPCFPVKKMVFLKLGFTSGSLWDHCPILLADVQDYFFVPSLP